MQEPQVALENAEYIYYASPNTTVRNNEEHSLYGNEAVYPEETPNGQYFKNLPQNILELQADLWTRVKSGKLSASNKQEEQKVYIQFAVLAGAVVVCITAKLISNANKKKFEDLSDIYNR